LRDLALVRGASAGFLFGTDFTGSGSEMTENLGVLKINRLDVFLTEIASHIFPKSKRKNQNEKRQCKIKNC